MWPVRAFRFSCNVFAIRSRDDFIDYCRTAENYGYDVVFTADHLGWPSPFPPLVAATETTSRLRVGTLVLNTGFWNPHLLARDVTTVDLLTEGRLELGLGAGHMRWEFDAAGIEWRSLPERADHLEATLDVLEEVFGSGGYSEGKAGRDFYGLPVQAPLQRSGFGGSGPPLIIGGWGDRTLALAARRANTVSFAGLVQVPGEPPQTFRMASASETEERVAFVRDHAGDRFEHLELNALIQAVVVTSDRRAVAEKLAADHFKSLLVDEVLETPFLLIGSIEEIAEQLKERRERFGLSFVTVHEPDAKTFAPVIDRLRDEVAT